MKILRGLACWKGKFAWIVGGGFALVAGLLEGPSAAFAQRPRPAGLEPQALHGAGLEPIPRVELFYAFGKTPVLQITYPWKAYSRASVELRFFSLSETDDERIQPLFFRTRHWKGQLLQTGYDCLLQAVDVPVEKSFSSEGLDWRLVADQRLTGRPALCIVREIPADARLRTESAIAVIYLLLEHWALDDSHLCLELPARYYPQAGQLRIWFLRDNRILWTQKLSWPGQKQGS